MKKLLAFILALIFVLSFAACGEEPTPKKNSKKDDLTSSDTSSPLGNFGVGTESKPSDTGSAPTIDNEGGNNENANNGNSNLNIVVLDSNDVKVTVTAIEFEEDTYSPQGKIKLLVENNTSQSLTFSTKDFSVNDCMIYEWSIIKVAAGKKVNDYLRFDMEDLETFGIDVVEKMEFYFHIYDSDSYSNYLDSELVTLTDEDALGNYTFNVNGTVLFEDSGIKVICTESIEATNYDGPGLKIYVVNNSGNDISVRFKETSINGFMVGNSFYCGLPAGKIDTADLTFSKDDIEENNISSIEEVEFYIDILDANTYNTLVKSDTITLTF